MNQDQSRSAAGGKEPGNVARKIVATKPAAKKVVAKKGGAKKSVAARTVAKTAALSVQHAAKTPKASKSVKPLKTRLVRDSFTIPKDEYEVLAALKARALGLGQPCRKSELLRAGVRALEAMSDRSFLAAVKAVPTLKTGRPAKSGDFSR